ncbi:MAG TPA: glycoside hydrolase domain-containing protein [Candidatus Baltobacterales bacterium]|nr:glycoside hydrolase domain-containing protein [Candidatus Baltobacterales bacterium]
MQSIRGLLANLRTRSYVRAALTVVFASNQLTVVALAAAPGVGVVATHAMRAANLSAAVCHSAGSVSQQQSCSGQADADPPQLSLPDGATQCPASGPAASCSDATEAAATPGVASIPDGQAACPVTPDTPALPSPAACTDTVLPTPTQGSQAPAASAPVVTPSVPISSLEVAGPSTRIELTADSPSAQPGQNATLTATASASVTGTGNAIEIFDLAAGTLIGACTQSSQCIVSYAAKSGVHTFAAFVTGPTATIPVNGPTSESNQVDVSWIGVTLDANSAIVGPGKSVTMTARATIPVEKSGYLLELYDADSKARLTFCSRGTSCTTSVTQAAGGTRHVVAAIAKASGVFPPAIAKAQSDPLSLTWLAVNLAANTTYPQVGGTVYLTANANADVSHTPWSIGIYDQQGHLVDKACKTGATCSAQIILTSAATPWFTAVVGAVPPVSSSGKLGALLNHIVGPASLVNIQASSTRKQPTRMLWGVDSCKAFTSDPTGANGLYPQVVAAYGAPDFWGRYLTDTVCPGISATEVAAAAHNHMGILPIYNDYDCSNVSGYATGNGYAAAAAAAASTLGIPSGRALAIDIEPPGDACPGAANVDAGFIQGWFDGITAAHYVPAYYGNGTAGSEFAGAWCGAVGAQAEVGTESYLWSFEPSLLGSYTKATAPNYSPEQTGCAGIMAAWQYELSAGSNPDVDTDEALSKLPLWFP